RLDQHPDRGGVPVSLRQRRTARDRRREHAALAGRNRSLSRRGHLAANDMNKKKGAEGRWPDRDPNNGARGVNETVVGEKGMVVAPHRAAAEAGAEIMRAGGNAIEAIVAAAATVAVVYPHMNGIGGDAFFLIAEPGKKPRAIDACGRAGSLATIT